MPRAATKETMTTTPMTSMKMRRCAVYAPSKTLSTTTATKENDAEEIFEGFVFASERCMDAEEAKAVRGARDACGGAPAAYGRARGAALCASSSSSSSSDDDENDDAEILVAAHGSWILAAHGCDPAVVAERLARACSSETSSRRVQAARATLKDLAGEFKNFAVIAFDGVTKRGLAARGGSAPTVLYGHDDTGALALVLGKKSLPGFDVAELKSGRFIFGHGYVKPMEFGSFWASARSSRAASPAKSAYGDIASVPHAVRLVNGAVPTTPTPTRTTSGLARASPNSYVPPAMRAAAAAKAEAAAAKAEAEAAEARRKSEALDRALAQTLHDEERMVSALGGALASALIKATGRTSFAADESIKEISRFHAARAHRQKIEAISSFYAPAVAAPASDVTTRRGSLDHCARASMESVRRGSLDSRLASFEASRFGAAF